ncbi:integral membrane protein [Cordyceps fumosorosea ARSEF 2679]|uniref:Integral membrane protein n=1 Tax=Cordyceps fumosorosea (strain ARSEF 2679) TaxID=1081104 RepID=A0A167UFX3_CORFA|nr:integral membrane protein [Cordyceps fumosorosea ARSEF 2679]OAA61544.1 integral membrane protein [Cordyceps fumosorosea ARSEF 2679]
MAVGRALCVALPLLLTIASLAALLYATLAGVAHRNTFMFKLDTTNLTLDRAGIESIAKGAGVDVSSIGKDLGIDIDGLLNKATGGQNITAKELNLDYVFEVDLWGFCYTKDNKRNCTKAEFDWASSALNDTYLKSFGTQAGVSIPLPKDIQEPIKAFRTIMKVTEIAFIAANIMLGVELLIGILASCSRFVSCVTWLIACITTTIVFAAAALATGTSATVVGAVEATAKVYGVRGGIQTSFLAAVWISAAFALGASLFWVFTICCCKPDRARSARNRDSYGDGEKLMPSRGYAPLGSQQHEMTGLQQQQPQHHTGYNNGAYYNGQPARYPAGNGRSDLAYEPYSHRA